MIIVIFVNTIDVNEDIAKEQKSIISEIEKITTKNSELRSMVKGIKKNTDEIRKEISQIETNIEISMNNREIVLYSIR